MSKLLKLGATLATGLGMTTGIASASTGTISTTGPSSANRITEFRIITTRRVTNTNSLHIQNVNCQTAQSGNIHATHNTSQGSVTSGNASNTQAGSQRISFRNDSLNTAIPIMATADNNSINNTGPDSQNHISSRDVRTSHVINTTNVNLTNVLAQRSSTGSVAVTGNTSVGDIATGDASNVSTNQFILNTLN